MLIGKDDLVRRDADLPGMLGEPTDTFFFPFFLVTVVCQDLESGKKLLELHFPVEDDRGGDNDEMLTPDAFVACEMAKEGYSLDRFAVMSADFPSGLKTS